MLLGELASAVPGARLSGSPDAEVLDLACDSRTVKPGTLFLALPGEKTDGADYARAAAAAGAVAVLSEKPVNATGLPEVMVPDARSAMALLARKFFGDPAGKMKLVAVTGTNGKTTTAYMVRHILGQTLGRCGMTGTVEYDLGSGCEDAVMTTPESLDLYRFYSIMARAGCSFAVSEVSSHALVKGRIAGLGFAVAVFTNLTQDHLDFHLDMDSYFRAKALLFDNLDNDSRAVINIDDAWGRKLAAAVSAGVTSYGSAAAADVRGRIVSLSTRETVFDICFSTREHRVRMGLAGRHNVQNALAAAAACVELGAEPQAVARAINSFPGVPGRLEPVNCGQDFQVLVDYAHTDDALRSVLAGIRELHPARIITLFGCGGDRDRSKRPRMAEAVEANSDLVIVTSDNPRSEKPEDIIKDIVAGLKRPGEAMVEPDRARAIERAVSLARAGDVVLIAGKGHENRQIIGDRIIAFDDRAVARKALDSVCGEGS